MEIQSHSVDIRNSTVNHVQGNQYNIVLAGQVENNRFVDAEARRVPKAEYKKAIFKQIRGSTWTRLHCEPYTVLHEEHLPNASPTGFQNWLGGIYSFAYPSSQRKLATIDIQLDWNAFDNLEKPSIHWKINTPESLYHPGSHHGQLFIIKLERGVFGAQYRVLWESRIFSPFVPPKAKVWGNLSSDGSLEEDPIICGFTSVLQSIAHFLAFGPYDERGECPPAPYSFHHMCETTTSYYRGKDKDAFARAASFFARAYTVEEPEEDHFNGVELTEDCRETSILVIRELSTFYPPKFQSTDDPVSFDESVLRHAFASLKSHREWAIEERRWADKLTDACSLRFLQFFPRAPIQSPISNHHPTQSPANVEIPTVPSDAGDAVPNSTTETHVTPDNGVPHLPVLREALEDVIRPAVQAPIADIPLVDPVPTFPSRVSPLPMNLRHPPEDWTPLHRAVWRHDIKEVSELAKFDDVHSRDDFGWTPLHLACSSADSRLFCLRQVMNRGRTTVPVSWSSGRIRNTNGDSNEEVMSRAVVEILLAAGANPNARASYDQMTALHCAANSGWTRVARALLEAGALVYTGPTCSPVCWALGGSGGSHPTAVLLRERLGPEGWKRVLEDHQRLGENAPNL